MKIIREDKNEIWFSSRQEAEQYCYDNNLWIGGIDFTTDRQCEKWYIVGESCYLS